MRTLFYHKISLFLCFNVSGWKFLRLWFEFRYQIQAILLGKTIESTTTPTIIAEQSWKKKKGEIITEIMTMIHVPSGGDDASRGPAPCRWSPKNLHRVQWHSSNHQRTGWSAWRIVWLTIVPSIAPTTTRLIYDDRLFRINGQADRGAIRDPFSRGKKLLHAL